MLPSGPLDPRVHRLPLVDLMANLSKRLACFLADPIQVAFLGAIHDVIRVRDEPTSGPCRIHRIQQIRLLQKVALLRVLPCQTPQRCGSQREGSRLPPTGPTSCEVGVRFVGMFRAGKLAKSNALVKGSMSFALLLRVAAPIHVDHNDEVAEFSFSERTETAKAVPACRFDKKSARGVKKNHHKDNWLMAPAQRSCGPNFGSRPIAEFWRHPGKHFTRKCSFQNCSEAFFCITEEASYLGDKIELFL